MTPELWMIAGVLGGIVAGVVAFTLLERQKPAKPPADLDALAVEVERLGKIVRRISMRNLREDALDVEKSLPPMEPKQAPTPFEVKQALRRKYLGGREP